MQDRPPSVFTDRGAAWDWYEQCRNVERMGGRTSLFINPRSYAGQPCPYCSRVMRTHDDGGEIVSSNDPLYPTRDHIVPRAQGGEDAIGNVAVVCRSCNDIKSDLTVVEWRDLMLAEGDPQAEILSALIEADPQRFARSGLIGMKTGDPAP